MTHPTFSKEALKRTTSDPDNFGWSPLAWAYEPD